MPQEKTPAPFVILSDAPTAGTGLARITNDLATRITATMGDVCKVATMGYGGFSSSKLPFHHYPAEGINDFVTPNMPEVWDDWAGKEQGVLLTIWDLSRLGWLSAPKSSEQLKAYDPLRRFLLERPFKLWGYFPIDATSNNDKLTFPLQKILEGFDRRLAYGQWSGKLIDRSISLPEGTTQHLPHGIDGSIFYERNRNECRNWFANITDSQFLLPVANLQTGIKKQDILIGIVATNQARKDWALGIETVAILSKSHNVHLWVHTDVMERHWSIPALLVDYNLIDKTHISVGNLPDDKMAEAYSACDVTLGIGLGEGFGYPIHESLFCGTPCIHGNYGGAPEYIDNPDLLVEPIAYRFEGIYSSVRPVFNPQHWAEKVISLFGKRTNHNGNLDWNNLWPRWEAYLRAGMR